MSNIESLLHDAIESRFHDIERRLQQLEGGNKRNVSDPDSDYQRGAKAARVAEHVQIELRLSELFRQLRKNAETPWWGTTLSPREWVVLIESRVREALQS